MLRTRSRLLHPVWDPFFQVQVAKRLPSEIEDVSIFKDTNRLDMN